VKFENIKTGFQVTFFRPEQANTQVSSEKSLPEIIQKGAQKSDQKILDIIRQNKAITRTALAEVTGLSDSGVKKQLKKLQEKGLLKRIGPDKGGHWEVTR